MVSAVSHLSGGQSILVHGDEVLRDVPGRLDGIVNRCVHRRTD